MTSKQNSLMTNLVSYQIWKSCSRKLEKTKYYDAAKKKYDNLKKQIEAVQINSQFESDALVDGNYNASIAVKSDANFNNLPESVTTTGNASLDSTVQEAIKGELRLNLKKKLRLRVQRLQRQLLKVLILLVLLHLQVITHLEQLLMVMVRPRQILLERKMEQLTQQVQQVQLVRLEELLVAQLQLQRL